MGKTNEKQKMMLKIHSFVFLLQGIIIKAIHKYKNKNNPKKLNAEHGKVKVGK
jgi:hypothetical protein